MNKISAVLHAQSDPGGISVGLEGRIRVDFSICIAFASLQVVGEELDLARKIIRDAMRRRPKPASTEFKQIAR